MYTVPPTLAFATVALANGNASVVALAAPMPPGAGLSYRLVAVQFRVTRLSLGVVEIDLETGTTFLALATLSAAHPSATIIIPEPGILLPPDSIITLFTVGGAVGGSGQANFSYFIDTIS